MAQHRLLIICEPGIGVSIKTNIQLTSYVLCLLLFISGCSHQLSQGKPVSDAQLASLIPGVTSYTEVETRFGKIIILFDEE
jgi:hypothetical protein